MPGSYTLELELFSLLNASTSDFEIWAEGSQFGGGYTISSDGTSISVTIPYGGALPTSLEFRFDDAAPGSVDQIEIRSVKINNKYVNVGNYLSSDTLNDGGSSTVDVAAASSVFDDSDPASSEFTTGATETFTAGNDTYRRYNDSDDEVFDMLGGRDVAYLGSGDDKVNGGAGNDLLRGGAGNDLLFGDGDDDRLFGEAGNDMLYGGTGNDRIHGGTGDDEIFGGAGDDRLNGHDDNDTIHGGAGNDKLGGGNGNDFLYGDADNDSLSGGAGDDTLDGGAGNDLLFGGTGADHLNGGDGNDNLFGFDGNDTMSGNDGEDKIHGQRGNDTLHGGLNSDVIWGGDDDDIINGGDNNDVIFGDGGGETTEGWLFKYYDLGSSPTTLATAGFTENGGVDNTNTATSVGIRQTLNPADYDTGDNYALKFETYLTITVAGVYTFRTTSDDGSALFLNGRQIVDNDGLHAAVSVTSATQNLNATIYKLDATFFERTGGNVMDVLMSGPDTGGVFVTLANYLGVNAAGGDGSALSGDDIIDAGDGDDSIYGDAGADIIDGGAGDDYIVGGFGSDIIDGGAGNDTIFGGEGTNNSNNGNDTINGGTGNDVIDAGAGTDTVNGGDNNDVIDGGGAADILNGDAGNDTFLLANNDFVAGESIDGGNDTDEIIFTNATTVDFTTGTLANLETLTGSTGNDNVTYTFAQALDFTTIDLSGGNDSATITFNGTVDLRSTTAPTVTNVENGSITGSTGNDNIIIDSTTALDSFVYGTGVADFGTGSDRFTVTETSASLNTLALNDAAIVNITQIYTINGATGTIVVDFSNQTEDMFFRGFGADETFIGGAGDDILFGEDGLDTLRGGAGDDYFFIDPGELVAGEIYDGGADNDRFQVRQNHVVDLSIVTITDIEELIGSTASDQDITATVEQILNFNTINLSSGTDTLRAITSGTTDVTALGTPIVTQTEAGFLIGSTGADDLTITGEQLDVLAFGTGIIDFDGGTDVLRLTSTSANLNTFGATDGLITGLEEIDASTAAASVTIDLSGQIEGFILTGSGNDDVLTGGSGNDTINGGAGSDIINGGAGNDTIYSSDNSAQTAVADILAANPGVAYNESTGNFYQYINSQVNWDVAFAAANGATLAGSSTGYLSVISSQAEQDFIWNLGGGNNIWGSGTDTAIEGEWFWQSGPENGTQFWTGGPGSAGGSAFNGSYNNWYDPSEPWAGAAGADYFILNSTYAGQWWTETISSGYTGNAGSRYVIEWEGEDVLATTGTKTLSGGDGSDTLYGTDNVEDTFLFLSGETGTDTIENFTAADDDAIDISDLLTGYTAGVSDINDFVRFTNSGANTLVQVDANGATGGASFTTIAQINGVNDLDADALLYNASIIA